VRTALGDRCRLVKRIHRDHPTVEVIILTDHEDAETIFEAIKAGAMGYLPKSATLEEIHSAIKIVADGGACGCQKVGRRLLSCEFAEGVIRSR
jgi:DNA-binding NarL/FixJ family response regulator